MIEATTLRLLAKKCPNYHIVSESFARDTYSLCTCAKCVNCIDGHSYGSKEKPNGKVQRTCKPLMDALFEENLPYGYSLVDRNGTCDRARFHPEDYTRFALEGQHVVIPRSVDEKPFREEGGMNVF